MKGTRKLFFKDPTRERQEEKKCFSSADRKYFRVWAAGLPEGPQHQDQDQDQHQHQDQHPKVNTLNKVYDTFLKEQFDILGNTRLFSSWESDVHTHVCKYEATEVGDVLRPSVLQYCSTTV